MKVIAVIKNCEVTRIGSYENEKLKRTIQQVTFDFKGGSIRTENHCPDAKVGDEGDFAIELEGKQVVLNDFSQMVFNPVTLVGIEKNYQSVPQVPFTAVDKTKGK